MEMVRIYEMPECKMVSSGIAMWGEGKLERFDEWFSSFPRSRLCSFQCPCSSLLLHHKNNTRTHHHSLFRGSNLLCLKDHYYLIITSSTLLRFA